MKYIKEKTIFVGYAIPFPSNLEFVTELHYSLQSALSINIQLTEEEIATICKEALLGLSYLHTHHRSHEEVRSDSMYKLFQADCQHLL